ncbi:MAG TPA: hypothetical protein VN784_09675 [Candidatus Limnocylindrales bacterium]|nr:hypothetical protein [Candidatus Limnocylindrales bacterium]
MESNWAAEHLQTIRTLMERSALYRHALAPIMLFAGTLGVIGTAVGLLFQLNSIRAFGFLWLGTAVVAVTGAFLIARRQALKEHEPFWSPPTRRVALALVPPLLAGLILGVIPILFGIGIDEALLSVIVWIIFYGCALHAAGFFMPRGIKFFGWVFIFSGCVLSWALFVGSVKFLPSAHWLMGFFFGVLHLAYGAYLYLTEKRENAE